MQPEWTEKIYKRALQTGEMTALNVIQSWPREQLESAFTQREDQLAKALEAEKLARAGFDKAASERDQLKQQLEREVQEYKKVRAAFEQSQHELDNKARELVAHREKATGNYWAWQGDGGDHLESIVYSCPVLISAVQLRQIIDERGRLKQRLEAELDRNRLRIEATDGSDY